MEEGSYHGNRKPYVYAVFAETEARDALRALEFLKTADTRICRDHFYARRSVGHISRSAAVVLFYSAASAGDEHLVHAARKARECGKTIVLAKLSDIEVPHQLQLCLAGYEGLVSADCTPPGEGLSHLGALSGLCRTRAQVRRGNLLMALAPIFAALALAAGFVLYADLARSNGKVLDDMGLRGLSSLKTTGLYIYGNETRSYDSLVRVENPEEANKRLLLYATGETIRADNASADLSFLSAFDALQSLTVAGRAANDLAPLFALTTLKTLNLQSITSNAPLTLTGIENLSALQSLVLRDCNVQSLLPLLACKALKKLYISGGSDEEDERIDTLLEELGEDIPFGVVRGQSVSVADIEQLKTAAADEWVNRITLRSGITINEDIITYAEIVYNRHTIIDESARVSAFGLYAGSTEANLLNRGEIRAVRCIVRGNMLNSGTIISSYTDFADCSVDNCGTFSFSGTLMLSGSFTNSEGAVVVLDGDMSLYDNIFTFANKGQAINRGNTNIYAQKDNHSDLAALQKQVTGGTYEVTYLQTDK